MSYLSKKDVRNRMPLTPQNRVLSHDQLPNWIIKGKKEAEQTKKGTKRIAVKAGPHKASIVKHTNLMRPIIAAKMDSIIKEDRLTRLAVTVEGYGINRSAIELDPAEKQLIVCSNKANILGDIQSGQAFTLQTLAVQEETVQQMCGFIMRTGMTDVHFGNIGYTTKLPSAAFANRDITEEDLKNLGPFTVIDTELHGPDTLTLAECAVTGICRFRDSVRQAYGLKEEKVPESLELIFAMALMHCDKLVNAEDISYIPKVQKKIDDFNHAAENANRVWNETEIWNSLFL